MVAYEYPVLDGPAPLCACGCGGPVRQQKKVWSKWRKGHHMRKHRHAGNTAKDAKRDERMLRKYGLTIDAYLALLAAQDGVCGICRTDDMGTGRGGNPRISWCIDHDHDTGDVRGLLCHQCNAALGLFQDDPGIMHFAIEYLRNHYIKGSN